ncbi:DUF6916 family protein [Shewanella sedimentimangrovi]|uniref:DUF6916 domain-containing protein n=1 Tax=Shewanella sedimentimangrovi TaxID=2814293 RepID=A0ABX7R3L6_9GAMM|nr:hypothetical protein [Shewanella sedimentimangrovi]QSX37415.1 hypothetical protein JYB85_00715 [Shewanella sedimentimangrovi]
MEKFTKETLEGLIGKSITACKADSGGELAELVVEKVSDGKLNSAEFSSMSVELSGLPEAHLPESTYLFKHDAFGEVLLYMSPYDIDKYQIIVSRKKTS